jgi:NAD(P)-dependent dehydrogenase (short-subunit alcohol dehydrogenase family)
VERKRRETPPGMRFLGLNALVTGSSRGFGRLIAIALAKEGANVVVHYNTNREGAEKTAEEIRALGRRAYIARADITKWSEVQEMVEKVWKEFGPIDVLINNAGETAAQQMSWREMREEWIEETINLDLKGTLYMTHEEEDVRSKDRQHSQHNLQRRSHWKPKGTSVRCGEVRSPRHNEVLRARSGPVGQGERGRSGLHGDGVAAEEEGLDA